MIKTLKRRFIVLAMVSLAVLLAVIVAGMNIINYQKVVSDADIRIEVLEENSAMLLGERGGAAPQPFGGSSNDALNDSGLDDDGFGGAPDDFGSNGFGAVPDDRDHFFGRGGPGGPSMTRDEAEESRFFTVNTDESGIIRSVNTERIYSVDSSEAESMAEEALASGKDKGFIGDFRYSVDDSYGGKRVTFLDCGRVLASFRDFLRASIIMSLTGLLIVFAAICYFAERIVRPVAESYEKQKRFITDAGHEIKTPLAIIKANVDLMEMEIDNSVESGRDSQSISIEDAEGLKENLSDINDQITRLTGLTDDLVYLSRMEEAEGSLVMTEVPLSDIVSETAASFRPLAEEQGKAINTDIEPLVSVQGSTKELEKLLSIIIENAVKYSIPPRQVDCGEDEDGMPAPPVIYVKLRKEGKEAVIEVRNETENELTKESLSHVFERFYRMDGSRNSQTGGHGIGLSMASAIVNAHGGKINAHTESGRDFIVTVSLPLV